MHSRIKTLKQYKTKVYKSKSSSSSPYLPPCLNSKQGRPPHRGNEAEIFIIAILEEIIFLAILGGKKFFGYFRGKKC